MDGGTLEIRHGVEGVMADQSRFSKGGSNSTGLIAGPLGVLWNG